MIIVYNGIQPEGEEEGNGVRDNNGSIRDGVIFIIDVRSEKALSNPLRKRYEGVATECRISTLQFYDVCFEVVVFDPVLNQRHGTFPNDRIQVVHDRQKKYLN